MGKMLVWKAMDLVVELQPVDIHSRPKRIKKELDGAGATFVSYLLTDGSGDPVFRIHDYRESAKEGWWAIDPKKGIEPEVVSRYFNGFAHVVFHFEETEIPGTPHRLVSFAELTDAVGTKPQGVLTHVGHGRLEQGGLAAKVAKNIGYKDSAITVVATIGNPAVLEQYSCSGESSLQHFLFASDRLTGVNGPISMNRIQQFMRTGVISGT